MNAVDVASAKRMRTASPRGLSASFTMPHRHYDLGQASTETAYNVALGRDIACLCNPRHVQAPGLVAQQASSASSLARLIPDSCNSRPEPRQLSSRTGHNEARGIFSGNQRCYPTGLRATIV